MFLYSYILLWILVIALTLSMIVIIRRITPSKPRLDMDDVGLEIGTKAPIQKFKAISRDKVDLIMPNKSGTVVLYLSVNCSACTNVLSYLSTFIKIHNDLSVVVFMQGENESEIIQKAGNLIDIIPFIRVTDDYLENFKVTLYPYSYFLSSKGTVLAKGGVPAGKSHLDLLAHLGLSSKNLAS